MRNQFCVNIIANWWRWNLHLFCYVKNRLKMEAILLCALDGIGQDPVILRGLVGHGPFINITFGNTVLVTTLQMKGW
jgi:hypothetical protein